MDMNMYFNYSLIIAVVSLFSFLVLAIGVAVLLTVVWRINRAEKKEEEKAKAEPTKAEQAVAEDARHADRDTNQDAAQADGDTAPAAQAVDSDE